MNESINFPPFKLFYLISKQNNTSLIIHITLTLSRPVFLPLHSIIIPHNKNLYATAFS